MSIYKLVVINTSNGFFVFNLLKHLTLCNEKSHYFLFKFQLNCTALPFLNIYFVFEDHMKPALPDIGKKIAKLPHKRPVFGNILTYKYFLVQQVLHKRECHSMCIRRVSIDKLQFSRMFLVLSLGLFKKILPKLLHID